MQYTKKRIVFFPKNTATDVYSFPAFNTGYKLSRAWQQLHYPRMAPITFFFFALGAGNQFSLRSTCAVSICFRAPALVIFRRTHGIGNIFSRPRDWYQLFPHSAPTPLFQHSAPSTHLTGTGFISSFFSPLASFDWTNFFFDKGASNGTFIATKHVRFYNSVPPSLSCITFIRWMCRLIGIKASFLSFLSLAGLKNVPKNKEVQVSI